MDLSSQESSRLSLVSPSLLVSIKDDELETEGEESLSTDAEDGGHKNDKVNSVSALMGDASREGGDKEEHEILKRGFLCCAFCGWRPKQIPFTFSGNVSLAQVDTVVQGLLTG